MGFLETLDSMEIVDTVEEQEETVVDTYSTEIIEDDNNSDENNVINEEDLFLIDDEELETTETIVYETIDYSEQLNSITDTLGDINLIAIIIACSIISSLVFGFMRIRKEGDL